MSTTEQNNVLQTTIRRQQMGSSYLEIYTKTLNGQIMLEAFTLASLAEVLGWPMSTMEGRYARAKLHKFKIDIPMRSGRPARGFPLAMLDLVIQYVTTPGLRVESSPNSDTFQIPKPVVAGELVPTYYDGKRYFTLPAMADHYGVSSTTIRNKLAKAGLLRRMVTLGSNPQGGRPRRGMPESAMGDVSLALDQGVQFKTELDRIMASAVHGRPKGADYAAQHMPPHTPPVRGSMQAYDNEKLAPVVPISQPRLNAVNTRPTPRITTGGFDSKAMADELMAELSTLMTLSKPSAPAKAGTVAQPAQPSVATSDDPHVIKRQAWEWQAKALADVESLSDGDLRDTCEMLGLDKAAAERFVGEVKAARRTREESQGEQNV